MTIDDCESSEASPILTSTKKFCLALQSEEKRARKQALVDFETFLKTPNLTQEDYHLIFKESHIYLLNAVRDKSEPVREQAIKFFTFYIINKLPNNDFYLSYLFPLFIERIGTVELVEESEEIRLQLVQFIQSIIKKYKEDEQLKPFLNDFIIILKETVQDKYPAIKETSCKCIVSLAEALPRDFHMQAENLVQPVLTNFNHQRYKIRIEAIRCISEIVIHSSYKALEDVVGPMAERLFDQIPAVRRTVAQVAARWLLEYRDRYSFFHKLLPLILTGLNDEVPETRAEAYQLWLAVGVQYQNENEKDLKDQLDFLIEAPKYYPEHLERPNLGCRVLVQRTIGKLVGALSRELGSWQADVRVRCSQLLCSVAQHAEEGLTLHLQDLLSAMYSTARDEDERVVVNIILASELMGNFVPVDTWKKLILPVIEDGPHYGHLTVLSAFIRGSPKEYVSSSLREIAQLLADPNISHNRKMKYQQELIKCVEAIQSKYCRDLSSDICEYLFHIVITILSVKDKDIEEFDFGFLGRMTKDLEIENEEILWKDYTASLLKSIEKDPKSWTEVTVERCIFEVILTRSGESFGRNLEKIGEILVGALDINGEPESRLKTFMALSCALEEKDIIFKHAENLQQFLEKLVTEAILPSLVWHAGRTAEAMRTMAASCLCSALSPGVEVELFNKDLLRSLFVTLSPLLISLSEDASYRSRHLAMEGLVLLKEHMVEKGVWELDDLVKIYPEILKRLDDPTEKIRVCAVKSLDVLLEKVPCEFKNVTFKSHHEYLMDTLVIHFDDDNVDFQELVKNVFKTMALFCKDIVVDKLKKHKPLIRNQSGCDDIIEHLKNFNI